MRALRLVFFVHEEARGVQALPVEPCLEVESSEAARLAAEYLEGLRDRWRGARRLTALWRPGDEARELRVLLQGRWRAPPAFDRSRLYLPQAAALQA
jgi:hypothetical protein